MIVNTPQKNVLRKYAEIIIIENNKLSRSSKNKEREHMNKKDTSKIKKLSSNVYEKEYVSRATYDAGLRDDGQ